jgi:hypothetical protein
MKILTFFFLILQNYLIYRITYCNCLKDQNLLNDTIDTIIEESDNLNYESGPYDIIITEIMADPIPSVLLPEAEYIELYNNCCRDIDLSGWEISVGNKSVILYSSIINPGGYLILTGSVNAFDFRIYGNVIALKKFPVLTNTGQTIILRNKKGRIIHFAYYSDKWYLTDYKAEGGWSLEMIDTQNPCGNKENWSESTGYTGGTPGKKNSVADYNPDNTRPLLERAAVINDSVIKICFSEPMDSTTLVVSALYKVDPDLGNLININPAPPDFSSVRLLFEKSLHSDVMYTLTVQGGITDCAGNNLNNNSTVLFKKPELADSLDIIINEILFNPYENGEDFVEIYNRSDKTIDIRYFNISSRDPYSGEYKSCYPVIKDHYLFFPEAYILLTTNLSGVQQQYNNADINSFPELEALPVLPDDKGIVALTDNKMNIIDEFHYSDDMHFNLLISTTGVSLERINAWLPTNVRDNWHSASEDYGFATPGRRNSQYYNFEPVNKNLIIEPEVFSPDNDGYNDFISIIYSFDDPGYVANISIFDSKGRIVKQLVKNTLLGTCGVFTWDGTNQYNRKSDAGIYLIYTEVFDLKGNVCKFKNTCVLAIRIN